jgi:hypothetical protein
VNVPLMVTLTYGFGVALAVSKRISVTTAVIGKP